MLSACLPGCFSLPNTPAVVKVAEEVDRAVAPALGRASRQKADAAPTTEAETNAYAPCLPKGGHLISFHLNIGAKQRDQECALQQQALRRRLQGEALYETFKDGLDDKVLRRFLTARGNDVDKARALLLSALKWRQERQPSRHNYAELERQHCQGSQRVAGKDRWGRPVIVFDNSAESGKDVGSQMRCLGFVLEHALRIMEPPVEKYAIFIHLSDFTIFNNPPFASTRETCIMVTTCFPECCGTIILHNAPRVFQAAFAAAKPFIDPHTMTKIHFIVGDDSPGTANDAMLQTLIGSNWRELTGAYSPKETPFSSRGYVHTQCWRRLLLEERDWRQKTGNVGPGRHELVDWPGGDPDVVPDDPCRLKPAEDGARSPMIFAKMDPPGPNEIQPPLQATPRRSRIPDQGHSTQPGRRELSPPELQHKGSLGSFWMLFSAVLVLFVIILLRRVSALQAELSSLHGSGVHAHA
mmetsp:Transcript_7864/g.17429  ORF Transcript_7864/g.17429 Transcript_7864/m.17429 type:complete len:468 (+) Transcript_7864:84-1487(+)